MPEDTNVGDLVARLQITGTSREISTRLLYNSSDVKTNGTDYFTLTFTNLYLRTRQCYFGLLDRTVITTRASLRLLSSARLRMVDTEQLSQSISFHCSMHGSGRSLHSRYRLST